MCVILRLICFTIRIRRPVRRRRRCSGNVNSIPNENRRESIYASEPNNIYVNSILIRQEFVLNVKYRAARDTNALAHTKTGGAARRGAVRQEQVALFAAFLLYFQFKSSERQAGRKRIEGVPARNFGSFNNKADRTKETTKRVKKITKLLSIARKCFKKAGPDSTRQFCLLYFIYVKEGGGDGGSITRLDYIFYLRAREI